MMVVNIMLEKPLTWTDDCALVPLPTTSCSKRSRCQAHDYRVTLRQHAVMFVYLNSAQCAIAAQRASLQCSMFNVHTVFLHRCCCMSTASSLCFRAAVRIYIVSTAAITSFCCLQRCETDKLLCVHSLWKCLNSWQDGSAAAAANSL
eukprot:11974-Heterococcus_DN1.PRE.1